MIIDFHTHLGSWGGAILPDDTSARTVRRLESAGVDGAVVMPFAGLYSNCTDHAADNDRVFAYCAGAPGRLFPAFTVNPFFGAAALAEIRRCAGERGAKVLKLHPWLQGFSISSPEMDAVAGLCRELGVIVHFHDGSPVYAHPLQIARLCRDFPGLVVASGHAGLGDLWREAVAAARRYPDFILCLNGPRELGLAEIIREVPTEQLCAGSDMSTSDPDDVILWFRWAQLRRLGLPEAMRRAVEGKNAARLLGLADTLRAGEKNG
jgi:predicted TIM-barrel fold metal-dependent hydrolase